MPEIARPTDPVSIDVPPALEHLVARLPAKERACVLLKDVFDYSLEEVADLVDSTVGGVKAALNRGRRKLAAGRVIESKSIPEVSPVLKLYVERFNRRDWDGVRDLIRADARLEVRDAFAGTITKSPYFGNYERSSIPWKLELGEVDNETAIIVLRFRNGIWNPASLIRADLKEGRIDAIVDYVRCPWMIENALALVIANTVSKDDEQSVSHPHSATY